MPEVNDLIKSLINVPTQQDAPTVEGTFDIVQNPSLNRIANNGKALTQNISKLTQTLQSVLKDWGVNV